MTSITVRRNCAIALLLAVGIPLAAQEQSIRTISRFYLKPGQAGNFQAAVKEYNAVLKSAGWDQAATVWSALAGPAEYVRVMYHSKWAELDSTTATDPKLKDKQADLASISARINQCLDHSERIIDVVDAELSLPRQTDAPKMIRTSRVLVRPDKIDEYRALLKAELLPAVRKAGWTTFGIARTAYGGPRNEFRGVSAISSWADFDGTSPIVKAMGQEAYNRYLAKLTALIVEAEYNVYRFQPDLSYLPAAAGGTASLR